VVNVSLGSLPVNVSEDVGNTTVCVTLTTSANTERSLDLYINTEDNTAVGKLSRFKYRTILTHKCL